MNLTVDAEGWRAARVADAGLSTRARAVLTAVGAETFGDLADLDAEALRHVDRCGRQTYTEIVDMLGRVISGGPIRPRRTLADIARERMAKGAPEPVEEAPQGAPQAPPASPSINPEVAPQAPQVAPQVATAA